ncbi:hypothetical protein F4680DRAFT_447295 [Xylaria scruposa]|nr:hypothetical protein F4680DRAFT_447295 [Xylaria scruposa]
MAHPESVTVTWRKAYQDLTIEECKLIFGRLYLQKNKTLESVKEEFEKTYGLPVTDKKQYESILRDWGFVKKAHIEDWVKVESHIKKRKRKGKDTDVFISNIKKTHHQIDEILRKNRKTSRLRVELNRQPTPELPAYFRLETPPPQGHLVPGRSLLDALSDHELVNFYYPQLSSEVWHRLSNDNNSSAQLWIYVPTSQIWSLVTTNVGFPTQDSPSQTFAEISTGDQDFNSQSNEAVIPFASTSLDLVKWVMHMCTLLANGFEGLNTMTLASIIDLKAGVSLIRIDRNFSALKTFLSLDSSAVQATWEGLVNILIDLREWDAFKVVVDAAIKAHRVSWIKSHAALLVNNIALADSAVGESLSAQLLSADIIVSLPQRLLNEILFRVAWQLNTRTMKTLIKAGACFVNFTGEMHRDGIMKMPQEGRRFRPTWNSTESKQLTSLLLMAGFDVDCYISPEYGRGLFPGITSDQRWRWPIYARWQSTKNPNRSPLIDPFNLDPVSFLDILWVQGHLALYETMLLHSRSAKERVTVSGTLVASHAGHDQLRIYLDSRLDDEKLDRRTILEITLSLAAARGDAAAIESLVRHGVDVDTPMLVAEFSPVLEAAKNSQIEALSVLIDAGAEVTRVGDYFSRRHPSWSYEVFDYLFHQQIVPKLDAMSLIIVLRRDPMDERLADLILRTSVQIDTLLHGINLIQLAIRRSCDIKAVRFLHSRGGEIHSRPCPITGTTMLHDVFKDYRPYQEAVELVEFLLYNGAHCKIDVEQGGPTILELLALHGGPGNWPLELFITLLDRGASVNGPKERFPHLEIIPVWGSLMNTRQATEELIWRVIDMGTDIHTSRWKGRTPLQLSIVLGRYEMATKLLMRGADVNAPALQLHGRTALQAACDRRDVSLGFVQHLLDRGARVNDPGSSCGGFTALQCAINAGSISVLCLLLDAGADVNASANRYSLEEPDWQRPLDVAASRGRLDMVDILIRKNAVSQKQSDTPYDGAIELAEKHKHHAIAKMLRDRYEEQVKEVESATFREQRIVDITQQELQWASNAGGLFPDESAEQDQCFPNFAPEVSTPVEAETVIWDELEDPCLAILAFDEEIFR